MANPSRLLTASAPASALALTALLGCAAPTTCCPEGPPYAKACSESYYYYFHGNQIMPAPPAFTMLQEVPWRHMGRVRVGDSAATGVLIHPNFVLTAAHVVTQDFDPSDAPPFFSLAQPCAGCLPYGTKSAGSIWVPDEWLAGIQSDGDSMATRAYDWAVLEVNTSESLFADGVPEPLPMPMSTLSYASYEHLTPRAAGYGCGRSASGTPRKNAAPSITDSSAAFLGQQGLPVTQDGAGGGSVIRTTLEATAGMSGGPVWVEENGTPHLVGILVGSPQAACDQGENWVAGLTETTRQRILSIIATGSAPGVSRNGYNSGGGGFQNCSDLDNPTSLGPCAGLSSQEPGAECESPEAAEAERTPGWGLTVATLPAPACGAGR